MSEECELEDVLDLLSDEYARAILAATSVEPMSASTLSDRCDASLPTVYRRIERLQAQDLLEERTRVELSGNHHKVYSATLAEFSLSLADGDFEGDLERTSREDDVADRFTRMWEDL
ncbi:MAG: helix-turn-helix domain-containing protein [Haloarculaceae archaeon]